VAKYVYEFTQGVHLDAPEREERPMNFALNLHHAGKIMLDPDERRLPAHEEAAYASHRAQRIDVRVGVTPEGKLELIGGAEDVALLREVVRQTVRLHHDPNAVVSEASADVTIQTARVALRERP